MWSFKKKQRIEDPERLQRFLKALEHADWIGNQPLALESTFSALNDLVYHEILFYYGARKKQRIFSQITRGLSIFLGTTGVMIPLLAGADPEFFKPYAPYGYPLLVAAGSLLLVNRMFGATGGHIRYVTAQLELERLLTKFRLAWLEAVTAVRGDKRDLLPDSAFRLMHAFIDDTFRVIQEETNVWGKSISEGLNEYERKLPSHAHLQSKQTTP
ncbi:MAG: SLATT domain-containing protein [Acidovorax sp.]|nr:SLATT domain-containing protein [Acidovorax sp.]